MLCTLISSAVEKIQVNATCLWNGTHSNPRSEQSSIQTYRSKQLNNKNYISTTNHCRRPYPFFLHTNSALLATLTLFSAKHHGCGVISGPLYLFILASCIFHHEMHLSITYYCFINFWVRADFDPLWTCTFVYLFFFLYQVHVVSFCKRTYFGEQKNT